jgi:hypothetical protein
VSRVFERSEPTFQVARVQYADQLHETFAGTDAKVWIPVLAVILAAIHGAVQGAVAWIAARFVGPR